MVEGWDLAPLGNVVGTARGEGGGGEDRRGCGCEGEVDSFRCVGCPLFVSPRPASYLSIPILPMYVYTVCIYIYICTYIYIYIYI